MFEQLIPWLLTLVAVAAPTVTPSAGVPRVSMSVTMKTDERQSNIAPVIARILVRNQGDKNFEIVGHSMDAIESEFEFTVTDHAGKPVLRTAYGRRIAGAYATPPMDRPYSLHGLDVPAGEERIYDIALNRLSRCPLWRRRALRSCLPS